MKDFPDTFYWIALTDSSDSAHARAAQVTDDTVTTDEVLTEYLNFFCAAPAYMRRAVALAVEDILQNPAVKVIPQGRESFLEGPKLYSERPDKGYSHFDANYAPGRPHRCIDQ